jgi:hypothetical protein
MDLHHRGVKDPLQEPVPVLLFGVLVEKALAFQRQFFGA